MKNLIKTWIKKNIPSKFIELISIKGISITKIPHEASVISDLFPLRIEEDWNTHFELLDFHRMLNPNEERVSLNVELFFYAASGQFLAKKYIEISSPLKQSLDLKMICSELGVKEDGCFAVFHQNNSSWVDDQQSFLAERGYIGYSNKRMGPIKSYVHGNLDAIALSSMGKLQLLGNTSFFSKKYKLQHILENKFDYELFFVNPTLKTLTIEVEEKSKNNAIVTTIDIAPNGITRFKKNRTKNKQDTHVTIKSKLYLCRPVVFKIMPTSFDVFHG
ncbi:hypothetical protein N9D55_01755 [Flavobacteriaceae bacterium]|nr:hypothetical protein [Flavobacteriaceae bacterium]